MQNGINKALLLSSIPNLSSLPVWDIVSVAATKDLVYRPFFRGHLHEPALQGCMKATTVSEKQAIPDTVIRATEEFKRDLSVVPGTLFSPGTHDADAVARNPRLRFGRLHLCCETRRPRRDSSTAGRDVR